ncbi:periplasmic chaperone for outer membrane protein SurA [Roseovarius mucosus DSM 17069]|uniref:Parvulin-like PPIase n=1 Tax=Roseovarius mucosus DSM 17069 TaxID=1288298 RepID=A0A0A0HKA8_9RHOB|nr:peptidylprolyl isomerase [Roseovarius mucosus]KGM86598.1 periplasmic chaperone for outer membrane protein SurA [Roseovarius mucosus DSM 17069]
MTPILRRLTAALTLAVVGVTGWSLSGGMVQAQNLFSPQIHVNDQAITGYELQQRARLLTLFRAPGDPQRLAREQLIEERIKLDAARTSGLVLEDDMVRAGMEEFAGRANMTADQLIAALGQSGVSQESFREFVRAGITWRELTRARFAARVSVSEDDLERATRALTGGAAVRVLLSEIILPVTSLEDAETKQALAASIAESASEGAFAEAARRYSAAPSAGRGGRMNWVALSELPAGLRPIVLGLAPGEVSDPLPLDGALALFYMRDIEETTVPTPEYSAIEYAAYYIPGGRSEAALQRAAQVGAAVDTCDDLYGVAYGQPPEVLERGSKAPEEIPQDIAMALASLDPGESSTSVTRANGQTLVFLMLCGRSPKVDGEAPSVEDLSNFIRNQRIESFANGYLEQLRAEARIVEK